MKVFVKKRKTRKRGTSIFFGLKNAEIWQKWWSFFCIFSPFLAKKKCTDPLENVYRWLKWNLWWFSEILEKKIKINLLGKFDFEWWTFFEKKKIVENIENIGIFYQQIGFHIIGHPYCFGQKKNGFSNFFFSQKPSKICFKPFSSKKKLFLWGKNRQIGCIRLNCAHT